MDIYSKFVTPIVVRNILFITLCLGKSEKSRCLLTLEDICNLNQTSLEKKKLSFVERFSRFFFYFFFLSSSCYIFLFIQVTLHDSLYRQFSINRLDNIALHGDDWTR